MKRPVFRGSTEACLVHFRKTAPYGAMVIRERALVDFARGGGDRGTAYHWLYGLHKPTGESLIAVRHFFNLAGYKVDEFESLPELVRNLGKLFAYGIVSMAGLGRELGFRESSYVRKILLGRQKLSWRRRERAEEICREHSMLAAEKEKILLQGIKAAIRANGRPSVGKAARKGIGARRGRQTSTNLSRRSRDG